MQELTRVMGIDASCVATGVVVLMPHTTEGRMPVVCTQRVLAFKQCTGIERAVEQAKALDQILEDLRPTLAVIEGYLFTSAKTRLVSLAEVGTCLRVALWRREVPWIIAHPSQVKKFVLKRGSSRRKGELSKAQVAEAVGALWGYAYEDDNVVDAYVLAQIGLALSNTAPLRLSKPQREVLEAIRAG